MTSSLPHWLTSVKNSESGTFLIYESCTGWKQTCATAGVTLTYMPSQLLISSAWLIQKSEQALTYDPTSFRDPMTTVFLQLLVRKIKIVLEDNLQRRSRDFNNQGASIWFNLALLISMMMIIKTCLADWHRQSILLQILYQFVCWNLYRP